LSKTSEQYDKVIHKCRAIFSLKVKDYGTSWRIMRLKSLTDQLFIKANRIRNIEDNDVKMIDEGIEPEFIALVNYSIIALSLYDKYAKQTKELMMNKNHDYGEAWREMRINSFTDLILMKLNRVKQIEDNQGKTLISEGIYSHYSDILNYAVFALIKIDEDSN
jgi:hypothetical protein